MTKMMGTRTKSALFVLAIIGVCIARAEQSQPTNCRYEKLPTTFNQPSYLEFNNEFHLHGQYYVDLTQADHLITFKPQYDTIGRFYVGPHDADVDLWLYEGEWTPGSGQSQLNHSLSHGHEETIQYEFKGSLTYTLRMNFFMAWLNIYEPVECETVFFEAQMVPTSKFEDRRKAGTNDDGDRMPELGVINVINGLSLDYTNSTVHQINSKSVGISYTEIRIVKQWTIKLPANQDVTWSINASIGTEFIFGGSIGLLIAPGAVTIEKGCMDKGNCTVGHRKRINEHVLHHTLATGSDYTIAIFERHGQRAAQLDNRGIPFALIIEFQSKPASESVISCAAPSLPYILPGFWDEPSTAFHYNEKALLNHSSTNNLIKIDVKKLSYFRVHTLAHRVDIDLRLLKGTQEIASELGFGSKDEAIMKTLEPGIYDLRILFYGVYDQRPCETFDIEIALEPVEWHTNAQCSSKLPAGTMGPFPVESTEQYIHRDGPYTFDYENKWNKRDIHTINFDVTSDCHLRASLGFSFILYDLNIRLEGPMNITGTPTRNHETISTPLMRGSYKLIIGTSHAGSSPTNMPTCAEFDLTVEVFKFSHPSLDFGTLPTNLRTPGYLGKGNFVHFAGEFLLPLNSTGAWTALTTMDFTVTTLSMFRVWAEPHEIDIDFELREDNLVVATNLNIGTEETITRTLVSGKTYQLRVHYYRFSSVSISRAFYTANMELAIAPVSESNPPTGAIRHPPRDFISSYDASRCTAGRTEGCFFSKTEIFTFQQSSERQNFYLPFQVTGGSVLFKAVVEHDFLYGDVSVHLSAPGDSSVAIHGVNGYNRMEISPRSLTPISGNFTLVITEAAPANLPRWIGFTLTVMYEAETSFSTSPVCPASYLPGTLNSPTYLSALSGFQTQFVGNLLVPPQNNYRDVMHFEVKEDSIFALLVPLHEIVDVDVALRNGTWGGTGQSYISLTSYYEEAAHIVLSKGQYHLEMRFFPQQSQHLPRTDCFYYPAQFSVTPITALSTKAMGELNQLCSADKQPQQPPTSFSGGAYNQLLYRNLRDPFSKTISFVVDKTGYVDIDLYFNFPTGAISMLLNASSEHMHFTQNSIMGYNHQSIHRLVTSGTYTIVMHDPFEQQGRIPFTGCSSYRLVYKNTAAAISLPDRECLGASDLPTDLYSSMGGSQQFGGPQAADGSVRIFSEKFLLEEGEHAMKFRVKQPSYVRMFARGNHPEDDIDFILYKDNTSTLALAYSMGMGSDESTSFKLSTPGEYVLDVDVWDVGAVDITCPLFHFEFALKTEDQLKAELTCPVGLPRDHMPPMSIDVAKLATGIHGTYYFTQDEVKMYTSGYRLKYRMTVINAVPDFIYTGVLFDFVANDFRLVLSDMSGRVIETGVNSGLEQRGEYINFESWLFADLPAGTFYLDIEEYFSAPFDFPQYCHKFEFEFYNFGNPGENPLVERIWPEQGEVISASDDLYVWVDFAGTMGTPDETQRGDLVKWIKDNDAFHITAGRETSSIFPEQADLWEEVSGLSYMDLVFSKKDIKFDSSYTIKMDAAKFKNREGKPYVNPLGNPTFTTMVSECGTHGHVVDGKCQCDTGYTGPHCDLCASGYHDANGTCVADLACPPNYCSGHGQCVPMDTEPACFCDYGYTGRQCKECSYGFVRDGDACVPVDEEESEPIQCQQVILPTTLDTYGYLKNPSHEVHIREDFFIDIKHGSHDMTFSLQSDSILRILAEPHYLDIDIWLYRVEGTDLVYLDAQISLEGEEVMYRVLPGGSAAKPIKYLLKFKYFDWESGSNINECHSANIELAIVPVETVKPIVTKEKEKCIGSQNQLPTSAAIFGNSGAFPKVQQSMSIKESKGNFIVRSLDTFAGKIDFEIAPSNGWTMAEIHATTSSQFSFGDVALVLESGDQMTHCDTRGAGSDSCVMSSPTFNGHTLHRMVSPGKFSIWFYEPVTQMSTVSNCTVFDFSLMITFKDMIDQTIECQETELPSSLNMPGYVTPGYSHGYMHISGDFLAQSKDISLKVEELSVFRMSATSFVDQLTFSVRNVDSNRILKASRTNVLHPDLIVELPQGQYVVRVDVSASDVMYCPLMRLEMALKKKAAVQPVTCGDYSTPTPRFNGHLPFGYGSLEGKRFTAPLNGGQAMTPVTLNFSSSVFVSAAVVSDFLLSNLQIVMRPVTSSYDQKSEVWGQHNYNSHELNTHFPAGAYVLELRNTAASRDLGSSYPQCVTFDFDLEIFSQGQIWNYPCNASGIPLPNSFDGLQHLGTSDRFTHAGHYRVPDMSSTSFRTHRIPFNVSVPSVIRVKVEPHEVDIDLSLISMNSNGNTQHLADGRYTFNEEESIVYDSLKPGINYYLIVQFWVFDLITDECPEFIMHSAIAPEADFVNTQSTCVEDALPTPPKSDTYDSKSAGHTAPYQFQQIKGRQRSFTIDIETTVVTDFMIEVTNDFTSGDLSLVLSGPDGEFYGMDFGFGASIRQYALAAGQWKIKLYQAVTLFSGCTSYSILFGWRPSDSTYGRSSHLTLPTSLNVPGHLAFSGETHFGSVYSLFRGTDGKDVVDMYLQESSLVRVSTDRHNVLSEKVSLTVGGATNDHTYIGRHQGRVVLTIQRPNFDLLDKHADVGLELAVVPMSQLTKMSNEDKTKTCAESTPSEWAIAMDGNGHFQMDKDFVVPPVSLFPVEEVQRKSFKLKTRSFVHVSVGFNYIYSDLEIEIHSSKYEAFYGKTRKNHHEFREVMDAGDYTLYIKQYHNVHTIDNSLQLCQRYHLRVYIGNATDALANVDCASKALVPSSLNQHTPNSDVFNVYGHNFLMRGDRQIMYVNITTGSFLSLFTERSGNEDVTYHVYKTHPQYKMTPEVPVYIYNGQNSRDALYHLPNIFAGTSTQYEIELIYTKSQTFSSACPSFSMQLLIEPTTLVQQAATCPTSTTSFGRLPTNVTTGSVAHNEYYDGSITSYFYNARLSEEYRGMVYNTTIQVTSETQLTAEVMYDDVISHFEVVLYRNSSYGVVQSVSSSRHVVAADVAVYNGQHSLSYDLYPGQYTLALKAKVLSSHASTAELKLDVACFPLLYTLSFVPSRDVNTVIRSVTPATRKNVDPSVPLVIEIDFGTIIYVGSVEVSKQVDVLKNLVQLHPASTPSKRASAISPDSVTSVSGKIFSLSFSPSKMVAKQSYRLDLSGQSIVNSTGSPIKLVTFHRYSVADSSCGGHGVMMGGVCKCNVGYSGANCDMCAAGYAPEDSKKYPPVCKVKASRFCQIDSCGCNPLVADICQPLGVCTENTLGFTCKCPRHFAGKFCEKCAEGFDHYEQGCPAIAQCPRGCDHGVCDKKTGKCICDEGYSGELCRDCAEGYSGTACEIYEGSSASTRRARVVGGLLGAIVIIATIAFAVYNKYGRPTNPYLSVDADMESAAEMSMFDEEDDNQVGIEDDEPVRSSSGNQRNREPEPEPEPEQKLFSLDD